MDCTERPAEYHPTDPLTAALEVVPLPIILVDRALKIRWVNERGGILFGSQRTSLMGQSIQPDPERPWNLGNGPDFHKKVWNLFHGGDSVWGEELVLALVLDGRKMERQVRANACPVELAGSQLALIVLEDVSSLRELEQRRKQVERLSLTVQTVRAATHDLTQPLSVLVGSLELLAQHLDSNDAIKQRIDKISESADHMAEIVRHIQLTLHSQKKREILKAGTTHPMAYGRIDRRAGHDSP